MHCFETVHLTGKQVSSLVKSETVKETDPTITLKTILHYEFFSLEKDYAEW